MLSFLGRGRQEAETSPICSGVGMRTSGEELFSGHKPRMCLLIFQPHPDNNISTDSLDSSDKASTACMLLPASRRSHTKESVLLERASCDNLSPLLALGVPLQIQPSSVCCLLFVLWTVAWCLQSSSSFGQTSGQLLSRGQNTFSPKGLNPFQVYPSLDTVLSLSLRWS